MLVVSLIKAERMEFHLCDTVTGGSKNQNIVDLNFARRERWIRPDNERRQITTSDSVFKLTVR